MTPSTSARARRTRRANGVAAFAESPFEPLRETRLPNPQTLDRDGLVAFFASMGWIADLPDEARLPLLDEVQVAPRRRRVPAAVGDARHTGRDSRRRL